ncbi:MAG: hypothetical protein ABR498_06790, partial [Candidatus Dormibacteria bacterium]
MLAAALAVGGGVLIVAAVLSDAIATLVVTRGRSARWRPTRFWYGATWRVARFLAVTAPVRFGEFVLNVYPAVSLLGLLAVWLTGLVVGWALIYWRLGGVDATHNGFTASLYYAGTSIVALTYGAATGAAVRALSLVETVSGLGTIALLISYLPALYGAYSRRESLLLTLDDTAPRRLTPVRLIVLNASHGDLERFYRFCGEWERWTAEVLESHVTYPMLALFRSQHLGQSWITALGVVTDAATLACACIVGADTRESYFMHRRGRRAILDIADRLAVPVYSSAAAYNRITPDTFEVPWRELQKLGVPVYAKHVALDRLQAMANPYGGRMQELIDYLLAPHGFWGDSAEETVEDEVT